MKKKILSLALAVLMALPLSIFASAATVTADGTEKMVVPTEPQTLSTPVYYVSYQKTSGVQASDTNAGTSADTLLATWGGTLPMIPSGGTVVIPGKGYVGTSYTFPMLGGPVTITAFDPQTNTKYEGTVEVEPEVEGDAYKNGTQIGMFMIYSDKVLTIEGEYIFDDIVLLERNQEGTSKISVALGGKLVIKDNVQIVKMTDDPENILLHVDMGGCAFLHAVGFEKYTGTGTIVIDRALYENSVTDEQFAEFYGTVIDTEGNVLRGKFVPNKEEPAETTAAPVVTTEAPAATTEAPAATTAAPVETTEAPAATTAAPAEKDNTPATTTAAPAATTTEDGAPVGVIVGIIAAIVVIAAVVVVVIKKKKN